VSSAKSRLRDIRFAAISLIYILNNRGSSTDPWGTPAETLQKKTNCLLILSDVIFQISILHLMEELFLLQILTNIWGLQLAAVLNVIYIKKNILIPNVAEKNILILVDERKKNLIQSFCHIT
jgi:hypothetical protein